MAKLAYCILFCLLASCGVMSEEYIGTSLNILEGRSIATARKLQLGKLNDFHGGGDSGSDSGGDGGGDGDGGSGSDSGSGGDGGGDGGDLTECNSECLNTQPECTPGCFCYTTHTDQRFCLPNEFQS